MTTLHMQTETVHSAAQTLKQSSDVMNSQLQSVRQALQNLQAVWQGGACDLFFADTEVLIRSLIQQQEAISILADRVEREAQEWEQMDQRGAAGMQQVFFGGQTTGNLSFSQLSIPVSIAGLFALPSWLSSMLAVFLPKSNIVSPLADDQTPAPVIQNTTNPPQQKSKFGDLIDKAEKESQQKETQKQAETPKPKYISDYSARADDGTYLVGQEKSDSCAIASTKMAIKRATGVDVNESDLRKESNVLDGGYENNKKWGTSPSSLDDLVNSKHSDIATASYNDPGTQTIADLEKAANDGKGIVVSVKNSEWFGSENAHSVTVVGVSNESGQQVVLINDPWPPGVGKRLSVPTSDFEKAWWGDANYISRKVKE